MVPLHPADECSERISQLEQRWSENAKGATKVTFEIIAMPDKLMVT